MDELTHWIGRANEAAIGKGEEYEKQLSEELLFLDNIKGAEGLHEIAVAIREHPNTKYLLSRQDKESAINYADSQTYNELYQNVLKKYDYDKSIKDRLYTINIKGEQKRMRGEEVIKVINDSYTKFFRKMFTDVIAGDVPINKVTGKPKGVIQASLEPFRIGWYDKAQTSPRIDHVAFVRHLKKSYEAGKGFPLEFGVDGIRKVAKSMMIEMTKDPKVKKELMKSETRATEPIDFDRYWPHMHFDRRTALESLKRYTEFLNKAELPESQMEEILTSLTYRHHALTGEWNFQDLDEWKHFEVLDNISARKRDKQESINWFRSLKKAGPLFSRNAHMPGYSLDRQVANNYVKGLVGNYFRQMSQIFGRNTINDFNY